MFGFNSIWLYFLQLCVFNGHSLRWTSISNNNNNFTVFIGHANNIFGASMRLQGKRSILLHSAKKVYVGEKPGNRIQFQATNDTYLPQMEDYQEPRSKRGVIHLYNMVSCATGCNPLIYKGYGCYCGFLGSGYAVNGIDRCCKRHDRCYDTAKCPMFLEYIVPYYWKCNYHRPICAVEHGEFGGRGSCAHRLCECDRVLSECLSRFPCPSSRAMCSSSPVRLVQNALMTFP